MTTALELPTPDPRTFDETARPFAEAIASHYSIKTLIGRGGMGIVYLARDRRLDRLVAIKTLPPHLAADPAVRERFLRETRTAAGMSHPNIVPIHGADEIDGHVFFVMGFVDGISLAGRIREDGPLPPATVLRYLRDVAAALEHSHARGIIHRDVKAENILIDGVSDRAVVTDFGIARVAEAAPLTSTGQLLGTVYYLSPEQVSGDRIDGRSDLYSLGVVAFLALTGRFPFEADLASAVLVAHVNKLAPSVAAVNPAVPAALASIVDRCLEKNPARRFAGATELFAALEAVHIDRGPTIARSRRPALISETEAHAVWQRAAELEALTGVRPRPEPAPRPRDVARDESRTSGFRVDDVRAAASEAGIGHRYVDHVLAEHGLATEARPAPIVASSVASSRRPDDSLERTRTIELDGEIVPRDFDRLVNFLRNATGELGTTTAQSRELWWKCDSSGDRLQVSIVPHNGRTTVSLSQDSRRLAVRTTSASLLLVGGTVGPAVAVLVNALLHLPRPRWERIIFRDGGIILGHHAMATVAIAAGAVAALATSIPIARALVTRLRRRSAARLHLLSDAIASKVREALGG